MIYGGIVRRSATGTSRRDMRVKNPSWWTCFMCLSAVRQFQTPMPISLASNHALVALALTHLHTYGPPGAKLYLPDSEQTQLESVLATSTFQTTTITGQILFNTFPEVPIVSGSPGYSITVLCLLSINRVRLQSNVFGTAFGGPASEVYWT